MTAKQYLLQIRRIQLRMNAMAAQLECLRSAAECITPTYSDMPKPATRNIHKTEDAIIRILEWEERMQAELDRLSEVNNTIAAVTDPVLQSLLVKRYVENHTWETISRELFYSISQIKRLHYSALCEVEKRMNRNEPK